MTKPKKSPPPQVKQKQRGITQAAFARQLKVSQQYISKLIHSGKITPECIYKDGSINADKAKAVLKDTLLPTAKKGTQKQAARKSKVASYYTVKAEHEALKTELTRLELDEQRGRLIDKDLVIKIMVQAATSCKQKLLAIPTDAAHDVLGATSIDEVKLLLKRRISDVLEDLSEMYEQGAYRDPDQERKKPKAVKKVAQPKKRGNKNAGLRPGRRDSR